MLRMSRSSSFPLHVGGGEADGDAEHHADRGREPGKHENGEPPVEEAAENVASEAVRSEPCFARRRRERELALDALVRLVRGHEAAEERDAEEQQR